MNRPVSAVDTIRDARALPSLLNLLHDFDVNATIFVSTGRDDSARRETD